MSLSSRWRKSKSPEAIDQVPKVKVRCANCTTEVYVNAWKRNFKYLKCPRCNSKGMKEP